MDIYGIRVFKDCDPFYIELQIFKFQYLYNYQLYIYYGYLRHTSI